MMLRLSHTKERRMRAKMQRYQAALVRLIFILRDLPWKIVSIVSIRRVARR